MLEQFIIFVIEQTLSCIDRNTDKPKTERKLKEVGIDKKKERTG